MSDFEKLAYLIEGIAEGKTITKTRSKAKAGRVKNFLYRLAVDLMLSLSFYRGL